MLEIGALGDLRAWLILQEGVSNLTLPPSFSKFKQSLTNNIVFTGTTGNSNRRIT